MTFGGSFQIKLSSGDAQQITRVRLIRPGAATHSFDQDQRSMELTITALSGTDTVTVTAPVDGNAAPPGYYMLFVAKGANGSLLSVAHWVNVGAGTLGIDGGSDNNGVYRTNPPIDNPYLTGMQPFRDVLETDPASVGNNLTQGIGAGGTPAEGPVSYAPVKVTFTRPVALQLCHIGVSCAYAAFVDPQHPCPTVTGVSGTGSGPYYLSLSSSIPPGACTTFTFLGSNDVLRYIYLPGDVNMNGMVTGQDYLALVTAINDGTAAAPANLARYDINRNGTVTGQDVLRLVQLLNGNDDPPTQAWNGISVPDSCSLGGGGGDAPSGAGGDSMGPNGGETDAGEPPLTPEQIALVAASIQAGCAEAGVDAACCQQLIDSILP